MPEVKDAFRLAPPCRNVTQTLFLAMVKSRGGQWQVGPVAKTEQDMVRQLSYLIGLDKVTIYALHGLEV